MSPNESASLKLQEEAPEASETTPEQPSITSEDVLEVLQQVQDPELGVDIVNLGLVYGVEVDDDTIDITYTLTTMGCPIGPMIEAQMKQLLADRGATQEVRAEMVLRPAWTPEMMSDEAKAALGYF